MAEKIKERTLFDGEIPALPEVAEGNSGTEVKGSREPSRIIKVRPTLKEMEVGEEVCFPLMQMKTVRVLASELGAIMERKYQTKADREARVIIVTRTA